MAVKDLFRGSTTQSKLDDVQARLRTINTELDALNITSVPTSDLEVEEEQALRRLARREALTRVSSALSAEQAELIAQLSREKAEERRLAALKAQAEVDAAKAKLTEAVFATYELLRPLEEALGQLDKISPATYSRSRTSNEIGIKLGNALELLGAATLTHDANHKVVIVRTGVKA